MSYMLCMQGRRERILLLALDLGLAITLGCSSGLSCLGSRLNPAALLLALLDSLLPLSAFSGSASL